MNGDVRTWSSATVEALRSSAANLGVRKTGLLIKMLKARHRNTLGEISSIQFDLPRYGVYVEKGARRGHGGVKGSRWIGSDGKVHKTDPKSLGKMNTGRSQAKKWFNPVMTVRVEVLADVLVKHRGDMVINSILIR